MENFKKKMGKKTFLEYVWLGGGEKKINGGVRVFFL